MAFRGTAAKLDRFKRRVRRALAAAPPGASLPLCPGCGRDFTCPIDWEARDGAQWWILIRCGECAHEREVVVPDAEAAHFDEVLHRQETAMALAAERLDRERMLAEVDAFAHALVAGFVLPEDFDTPRGRR